VVFFFFIVRIFFVLIRIDKKVTTNQAVKSAMVTDGVHP